MDLTGVPGSTWVDPGSTQVDPGTPGRSNSRSNRWHTENVTMGPLEIKLIRSLGSSRICFTGGPRSAIENRTLIFLLVYKALRTRCCFCCQESGKTIRQLKLNRSQVDDRVLSKPAHNNYILLRFRNRRSLRFMIMSVLFFLLMIILLLIHRSQYRRLSYRFT